ncbi:MAG: hypothetical protein QXN37_00805 [Candidatus Anstonellaceae archaeon]
MHRFFQVLSAQASAELISVLGILLLILLTFTVLSSNLLFDVSVQKDAKLAKETVQTLANAADSVYAEGKGATKIVSITIPPSANLSLKKSYIGKPLDFSVLSNNIINLHVAGSDYSASTLAPLSGVFPSSPGTYQIKVISFGSYVSIGASLVEIQPSIIYHKGKKGQPSSASLEIIPSSSDNLEINIQAFNEYQKVPLAIFPSSFQTAGSRAIVSIIFQPSVDAGGVYNWNLLINTSLRHPSCVQECREEFFIVPVSFEIG